MVFHMGSMFPGKQDFMLLWRNNPEWAIPISLLPTTVWWVPSDPRRLGSTLESKYHVVFISVHLAQSMMLNEGPTHNNRYKIHFCWSSLENTSQLWPVEKRSSECKSVSSVSILYDSLFASSLCTLRPFFLFLFF